MQDRQCGFGPLAVDEVGLVDGDENRDDIASHLVLSLRLRVVVDLDQSAAEGNGAEDLI